MPTVRQLVLEPLRGGGDGVLAQGCGVGNEDSRGDSAGVERSANVTADGRPL